LSVVLGRLAELELDAVALYVALRRWSLIGTSGKAQGAIPPKGTVEVAHRDNRGHAGEGDFVHRRILAQRLPSPEHES
jgi:hypothetical protein